jgi:hypothetical protein
MNILQRLQSVVLPLALSVLGIAVAPLSMSAPVSGQEQASAVKSSGSSPLIDKVRAATARFRDINVAHAEGFVQGTPCVSGPDFGAMGVHFVLPARIRGGILNAAEPAALIYQPLEGGGFRLVGVEFIVLAAGWAAKHPDGSPPALDGHLLNLIGAPNRFGLPNFYEIHVWAWEQNPVGSFADWNTHVTCIYQPSD